MQMRWQRALFSPTTTVQARKAALDKRPAQTRKLRTERERRWVARQGLRDVSSAYLVLLQTGRDEERERVAKAAQQMRC
jgi:siroheme synthase (precorrin-2 oxidase/ferrochelatase)